MDSTTEQSIQLAFVFNRKSQAIVAVHSSPHPYSLQLKSELRCGYYPMGYWLNIIKYYHSFSFRY